MKLSDLINHCQDMINSHGDYELTRMVTSRHEQYKPIDIILEPVKSGWIKKKTVTEDEEVTVKRRQTVYKLSMTEDVS